MTPAGGAYTNYGQAYADNLPDDEEPSIIPQDWILDRQPQTNGELPGDKDLVDTLNQDSMASDESSAVRFERKAVNTADRFLDVDRHQTGYTNLRNDHLDGPVFSNVTSDEVEVGQYVGHFDTSTEFECDRNNYTSLTDSSME